MNLTSARGAAASARQRLPRWAAVTGCTLRSSALRQVTGALTAIVTVADDGGSSGRLRRQFGVLPPG